MRLMSKIALAGAAACTLAGTAYAADREFHRMNVALPDGSVAQLLYQGDVAPKVELVPVERTIPVALLDSPFARFDQMFAEMDRQAAVMIQHAAALQASAPAGGKIDQAALKAMPAGASYSFTAYSSSNGGCTQSYQMTAYGNAEPKVVSQSSGDCSKAGQLQAAPKPAKAIEAPKTVPHDAV
ncbi:hypothetical protein [Sphingomonas sp. 10B4]|uniref:hypothetical protein n=1 Tax=Sphingomonas sp. 10B4 TaxID=3048575 RepID=UPI002AB545E8|nr:hypothetical protein [Sphingomonas sp. 10B4]MDY7525225.1 hypothetical protein [Sphingomonas sp. 10B4]MEB0282049.1 hypothetical protein [Sphingomonas sp. 10B4]